MSKTASLILVLLGYGCTSNPVANTQSLCQSGSDVTFVMDDNTYELRDIPELRVDLPPEPRPWDKSIHVLRDSIAAHNGKATIGFKEPGSRRFMSSNGIREALCAEELKQGLLDVQEMGAEIVALFTSIGAASVTMDPDLVYYLVDHPRVDYIEIEIPHRLWSTQALQIGGDLQKSD